ncbi:hypothetical protein CMI42_01105 [Candidatus Pacearchaeota archaeon]|nr:hypothetical protein [Candidatus Pacearchaeota archaeon]
MELELRNKENIVVGKTEDKGKTYFARKNLKKGTVVYYFAGPIVSDPTDYTVPIGFGIFIDPTDYGGRYTNDYGMKANLGIRNRTQLVALKDIKKGEEIGPAYFMFVPFYGKGSKGDKLGLSFFEGLSKKEMQKYKNYISDYLFNSKEINMYGKFI